MPSRPSWAPLLDRAALRLVSVLGRLLRRPDDALLERLARRDRGPRPDLPRPPMASLDQARAALSRGELAEALHLFGLLLDEDPDHAWAWHGRGDALQLMGEHAGARAAYERAAALQPRNGLHRGGLANALRSLGRDAEADAALAEALRLDPSLTWMRPDDGAVR